MLSADIDVVNSYVNAAHIHTLLRELYKCLHTKLTSKYKEITPHGIKIHAEHVINLNCVDIVFIHFLMILQDIAVRYSDCSYF